MSYHLVTVEPLADGHGPITITHRGRIHVFYYRTEATIASLGRALVHHTQVPLRYQRLLARGVSLIKTKGSTANALSLSFLAGKSLLLLGRPSPDIDPSDIFPNAPVWYKAQDRSDFPPASPEELEQRALYIMEAKLRYIAKVNAMLKVVNKGPRPAPLTLEGATAGESVGEAAAHIHRIDLLVPGLGLAMLERFSALLGNGCIPRLDCRHVPTTSALYGCIHCIQIYFADWYAFSLAILDFQIERAREIMVANPGPNYKGCLAEMRIERSSIRDQYPQGTKLGVNSALSELIIDWCEILDIFLEEEEHIESETSADIDSFYKAIEILEGGLGLGEYEDLASAKFIIDMRAITSCLNSDGRVAVVEHNMMAFV